MGLGDCGDGPPLVALGTEVARGEVPRTQMVELRLASAVKSTPEFGLLAELVSTAHARSELAGRDTFVQLEQDTMLPPPCGPRPRWPQGRTAYYTVVASPSARRENSTTRSAIYRTTRSRAASSDSPNLAAYGFRRCAVS